MVSTWALSSTSKRRISSGGSDSKSSPEHRFGVATRENNHLKLGGNVRQASFVGDLRLMTDGVQLMMEALCIIRR
ncbi:hypothetical protein Poly51_00370 [Rubripirellula tenax]|uniref:Uncharacterized protein n=1 Tax=Rubripirellula tenax TaxID=2528015 RepID=A0A5C6FG21_9BACT|nr:hypothetical protein Poly51_00370 [Rubripirellula tenax]